MTTKEKETAICERMKTMGYDFDATFISPMVICAYLNDMAEIGLVEAAFKVTESGNVVKAICEEFDWQPSDKDIKQFVMEMMEESDRPAFMMMLTKYRDDRDGLKEEFEKFKKSDENS